LAVAPERARELGRATDARRTPARSGRLEPYPPDRRKSRGRGGATPQRRCAFSQRDRDRPRWVSDRAGRPVGQSDRVVHAPAPVTPGVGVHGIGPLTAKSTPSPEAI